MELAHHLTPQVLEWPCRPMALQKDTLAKAIMKMVAQTLYRGWSVKDAKRTTFAALHLPLSGLRPECTIFTVWHDQPCSNGAWLFWQDPQASSAPLPQLLPPCFFVHLQPIPTIHFFMLCMLLSSVAKTPMQTLATSWTLSPQCS